MELRNFIIATIKRLILDLELLENVEKQHNIIDSHDDFMLQCKEAKGRLQAILDYNFFLDEVDAVEPYKVEVKFVEA